MENGIDQVFNPLDDQIRSSFPGITGRYAVKNNFSTLIMSVNTSDTSVIGLKCENNNAEGITSVIFLNLTIYGKFFL